MPKLWEYKPSSKKSGYYIRANVGSSHPVTLQVTTIAQIIFQETGYKPNQSIPTKLVWAMYDLDLLYTNKSLDPSNIKEVSTEKVLRDLDLKNRLSDKARKRIISGINSYQGPQKQKLAQLEKELKTTSVDKRDTDERSNISEQEVPKTIDDAISYLYTLTYDVKQFRYTKRNMSELYLLQSLQTFAPHPHVDIDKTEVTDDYLFRYQVSSSRSEKTYLLTDHRGQTASHNYENADYVLEISDSKSNLELVIENDDIAEIAVAESGRFDLQNIKDNLEWVLPSNPVEVVDIAQHNEKEEEEDSKPYTLYTEFEGRELQPMKAVWNEENPTLHIAKVLRTTKDGDPIIEVANQIYLLDKGKPDEEYLVKDTGHKNWKVISKVI